MADSNKPKITIYFSVVISLCEEPGSRRPHASPPRCWRRGHSRWIDRRVRPSLATEESRDNQPAGRTSMAGLLPGAPSGHGGRRPLWGRSPRVFRHWIARPAFRMTSGRARAADAQLRRRLCRAWHGGHAALPPSVRRPRPTEAEPLHQRRCGRFSGMIVVEFTALRPNFVLRRQRQFVDAAACAAYAAFRRAQWNVRRRHLRAPRSALRSLTGSNSDGLIGIGGSKRLQSRSAAEWPAATAAWARRFKRGRMRGHRCAFDPVSDPAASSRILPASSLRAFSAGLGVRAHTGIIDAGRHHRDADDAFEAFVEGRADDDVGVLVDLLADAGSSFVDLVERRGPCRR